ncbi:MAG: hypothetical protein CVT60_06375 [Actinobacteria bacterium HGW-Actinobacteria-10]|jgi:hypothetical protein|nr:MAG: hypothetical protein CVT60_06375 [Actinobacteria bacterium HGW-Actinobacteria-10]
MAEITWRPYPAHGKPSPKKEAGFPDSAFAFAAKRKLPLTDEGSVRSAIENFSEVEGVSDEDREIAFANIRRAAGFYHVPMTETDWRQLGTRPLEPGYKRPE